MTQNHRQKMGNIYIPGVGMKEIEEIDFKAIFESIPGFYLLLDTNFFIIGASDAYLETTMVTRKYIMGKYAFDVYPENPDDPSSNGAKNILSSLNKTLTNKAPDTMAVQKYDIRRPKSKGGGYEVRYWSIIHSPVLSKDNQVKYIIHRAQDVTDFVLLKETTSEQLKIMDKLRTRAGEMQVDIYRRAQEIQVVNEQLQEANKHLYSMDQLRTQFFANVSHELRTPLMLILGPLEQLMSDTILSPEHQQTLKLIDANAHILLKHVNDLLDLAKLDAGKMPINYVTVNLVELVKQIADLFVVYMQKHQQVFSIETPDELIAQIDVDKIQRVVINLLANAIKFTPKSTSIKLKLVRVGKSAQIIIQDSGPGIPPELCEVIFERFFQVEDPNIRRSEGTGLGLAIAKEFLELHGGSIKANNADEGGAIFTVELPLQAPPTYTIQTRLKQLPALEAQAKTLLAEIKPQTLHNKTKKIKKNKNLKRPLVLVIEDNNEMNQYLCEILVEDYRVESAFDGKQGLKKALKLHPDLIVSDIMMPNMSGIQLVHEIRKHPELLTTPIIILTAKAEDDLCVRMLQEGAQDFMIKPFSSAEFKARVANLIIAKKVEDELERFVYLASHDLKAPLPAMEHLITWIEEDLGDKLAEQSKHHLKLLKGRASRMANLLDGLLMYSRAGQSTNPVTDVQTHQLVQDVIAKLNPPSTFNFVIDPALPVLNADKDALFNVFIALIGNSIKHHDTKIGTVKIGFVLKKDLITFCVEDDGPGIDKQYRTKIFQLFQTLQSRDILEGSGVGLSIAKKIVESKGGDISVHSSKNKGATFCFTWPAVAKARIVTKGIKND